MTFQALSDLSREPAYQGFYVPHFEIRVAGEAVENAVIRDVSQITYKDDVRQIDSVDITVNNWDDGKARGGEIGRFKYFGHETAADLADENSLARLFEPGGKQVEIWLGYLGALRLVSTVTFQSVEPSFPSSGAPTLQVRGLNVLHRLRKVQNSRPWYKARPSDIARDVGQHAARSAKGPKIAIEIDDDARGKETPIDFIAQDNEYDVDFLLNLARRIGYELTIVSNDPPKLRFGPSLRTAAQSNYRLVWGESLVEFKPRLTTARQVGKVTVQGWDRKTKKPIKVTVDTKDKEVRRINADLHRLVDDELAREELKVDDMVNSEQEARQRARAIMLDQMKQMVTAEGATVGLPELRAGSRLEIDGVGERMSGEYFVTETTHSFSDSGYLTRFKARREDARRPR